MLMSCCYQPKFGSFKSIPYSRYHDISNICISFGRTRYYSAVSWFGHFGFRWYTNVGTSSFGRMLQWNGSQHFMEFSKTQWKYQKLNQHRSVFAWSTAVEIWSWTSKSILLNLYRTRIHEWNSSIKILLSQRSWQIYQ